MDTVVTILAGLVGLSLIGAALDKKDAAKAALVIAAVFVFASCTAFRTYQDCQHPNGCFWDETPPGAECDTLNEAC